MALPRVIDMSYLDETDIFGLLTEALTADHEAVLADDTSLMSASAAADRKRVPVSNIFYIQPTSIQTCILAVRYRDAWVLGAYH